MDMDMDMEDMDMVDMDMVENCQCDTSHNNWSIQVSSSTSSYIPRGSSDDYILSFFRHGFVSNHRPIVINSSK